MTGPIDLSVIIPTWNGCEETQRCLASLFAETRGISYEVIVVDNGSSDGTPEMVAQQFPQVRLLRNAENLGFARAVNRGLAEARGRYLLLLNSDAEVQDNALGGMVAFLEEHPEVGAAGCLIRRADGTVEWTSCAPVCFLEWADLFPLTRPLLRWRWRRRYLRAEPQPAGYVTGAFLMARREAVEQVGLLDEGFFFYHEDKDWCWRMARAGYAIYFVPHIQVFHKGQGSVSRDPSRFTVEYYRSKRRLLEKWLPPRRFRLYWFLTRLSFYLKRFGWQLLFLLGANRAKARQLLAVWDRVIGELGFGR